MVARPFCSRKPNSFKQKSSPLWKCFHAHFDHFTAAYPRDYQSRYGVLRGVIPEVVDKFMGFGDFAKGFARVRCDECSHEYLLALFLQRRAGSARHAIRKRCKYSAPCLRSRSSRSCRIGISHSPFPTRFPKTIFQNDFPDAAAVLSISAWIQFGFNLDSIWTAQVTLPHRASMRE